MDTELEQRKKEINFKKECIQNFNYYDIKENFEHFENLKNWNDTDWFITEKTKLLNGFSRKYNKILVLGCGANSYPEDAIAICNKKSILVVGVDYKNPITFINKNYKCINQDYNNIIEFNEKFDLIYFDSDNHLDKSERILLKYLHVFEEETSIIFPCLESSCHFGIYNSLLFTLIKEFSEICMIKSYNFLTYIDSRYRDTCKKGVYLVVDISLKNKGIDDNLKKRLETDLIYFTNIFENYCASGKKREGYEHVDMPTIMCSINDELSEIDYKLN